MSPELKEKWVAALRSGKYKQGKKVLRTYENTFCCLGVLCDIANPNGWEPAPGSWAYQGNQHDLIGTDLDYLDRKQSCLANMNDGCGEWYNNPQTFEQIATWIEENM